MKSVRSTSDVAASQLARDEWDRPKPDKTIGMFEITKVVKEHVPVYAGETGTYGNNLDVLLVEAAKRGDVVQTIAFHIEEPDWQEFMRGVHNG